jgi:hypothetical protein
MQGAGASLTDVNGPPRRSRSVKRGQSRPAEDIVRRPGEESPTDVALDHAMATVLAAERSARTAVEDCARQAETIAAEARAAEKAIAERAARRCARVRAAMAARLAERLASIDQQIAQVAADTGIAERERLVPCVERLADEMTGGAP